MQDAAALALSVSEMANHTASVVVARAWAYCLLLLLAAVLPTHCGKLHLTLRSCLSFPPYYHCSCPRFGRCSGSHTDQLRLLDGSRQPHAAELLPCITRTAGGLACALIDHVVEPGKRSKATERAEGQPRARSWRATHIASLLRDRPRAL